MSKQAKPSRNAVQRAIERFLDRISTRPLSVVVFAGTLALFVLLQARDMGELRVQAVARSRSVAHPALVTSLVEKVYVQPGDAVTVGTPLVELSPRFLDREIQLIDLEIDQLLREAKLAQARLALDEERWLPQSARSQPSQPSLEQPTEGFFRSRTEALQARRALLLADRANLTVTSQFTGRVAWISRQGTPVAVGTSVAKVTLEFADEIVAYVPANTDLAAIAPGVVSLVTDTALGCREPAEVLRRGASIEEAPNQMLQWLRYPVHGMPVYLSTPEDCDLADGQVLNVVFPRQVL